MSDPAKAVFLSYASQDAEAAKRICDALRAAGVEVWFDQSELRGGDAWDAMIRKRIKECSLFVPVITPATNARAEGYFRLEWKLAVDRSHLMADDAPFLFPVVIGDVTDATARVPDKFRDVQWTRLRLDETPGELATRVARLLSGNVGSPLAATSAARSSQATTLQRSRWQWWMIFPILGTIMGLMFAAVPIWKSLNRPPPKPAAPAAASAAAPARDWPKDPELKKAMDLIEGLESIPDDLVLAEEMAKRVLDRSPADIEAVTVMARVQSHFLRRGFDRSDERAALAKRYAERALQLAPDEPEAMYALATYHFSRVTGETARTEQLLRRAMELDPTNPRPGRLLADLYNATNRPAEAIAQGQDNVRRFPNDVLSHYDLARTYKDQGRYDEFDRELDATLALAPLPNAIVWKARLQFGLRNDFAGMRTWLDRVPARVRGTERAVFGYFIYAAFGGDPEAGLEALRDFPQKWFTDFEYAGPTALLSASLLELQGKKELARRQYEVAQGEIQRMRQTDPSRIGLSQVEFWTLLGLGRTEEAKASHRRVVEGSRRPYLHDMVNGWWFTVIPGSLLIGDRATALTLLRESIELRPESRAAFRLRFQIDPRMVSFRDDPEIKALLAESTEKPSAAPARAVSALVLQGREMLEKYVTDDTQRETLTLAEELARRAQQADVTDADAWSLSAQVASSYIVTGRDRTPARMAELNAAAERAMQLAPKSDEALYARAVAYRLRAPMRGEAERLLRDLVQRNPGDRRFVRMLGNVLQNRQAFEEALAVYRQAAALPGGDARAELYGAEMLEKLGRPDEADAAADRSLAVQTTGAAALFKVNLARKRGDLAKARAELARVPPAVLLDDRGAAVAANVWLWSREPEKVIAALEAIPGDDLYNAFFYGPKSLMLGFAHQLAGRGEVAKLQWRIASKNLEQRAAADPAMATEPLYLGTKMFLDFLIGDPDKQAGALQTLRIYLQMGVTVQMDPAWDPAKLFTLLDRQDIMIDLAEMILKSGEMPNLREELRTSPLYAPLRGNPRFDALLVEPKK